MSSTHLREWQLNDSRQQPFASATLLCTESTDTPLNTSGPLAFASSNYTLATCGYWKRKMQMLLTRCPLDTPVRDSRCIKLWKPCANHVAGTGMCMLQLRFPHWYGEYTLASSERSASERVVDSVRASFSGTGVFLLGSLAFTKRTSSLPGSLSSTHSNLSG